MADDPGEGDIRTTMASKGVDRHCAIRYLAIEDLKARASNLFENEMKSLLQSEKATKTNEALDGSDAVPREGAAPVAINASAMSIDSGHASAPKMVANPSSAVLSTLPYTPTPAERVSKDSSTMWSSYHESRKDTLLDHNEASPDQQAAYAAGATTTPRTARRDNSHLSPTSEPFRFAEAKSVPDSVRSMDSPHSRTSYKSPIYAMRARCQTASPSPSNTEFATPTKSAPCGGCWGGCKHCHPQQASNSMWGGKNWTYGDSIENEIRLPDQGQIPQYYFPSSAWQKPSNKHFPLLYSPSRSAAGHTFASHPDQRAWEGAPSHTAPSPDAFAKAPSYQGKTETTRSLKQHHFDQESTFYEVAASPLTAEKVHSPASHQLRRTATSGVNGNNLIDSVRRCVVDELLSPLERDQALKTLIELQHGCVGPKPHVQAPTLPGIKVSAHVPELSPVSRADLDLRDLSKEIREMSTYARYRREQDVIDRLGKIEAKTDANSVSRPTTAAPVSNQAIADLHQRMGSLFDEVRIAQCERTETEIWLQRALDEVRQDAGLLRQTQAQQHDALNKLSDALDYTLSDHHIFMENLRADLDNHRAAISVEEDYAWGRQADNQRTYARSPSSSGLGVQARGWNGSQYVTQGGWGGQTKSESIGGWGGDKSMSSDWGAEAIPPTHERATGGFASHEPENRGWNNTPSTSRDVQVGGWGKVKTPSLQNASWHASEDWCDLGPRVSPDSEQARLERTVLPSPPSVCPVSKEQQAHATQRSPWNSVRTYSNPCSFCYEVVQLSSLSGSQPQAAPSSRMYHCTAPDSGGHSPWDFGEPDTDQGTDGGDWVPRSKSQQRACVAFAESEGLWDQAIL